jgi:hypothetical protein
MRNSGVYASEVFPYIIALRSDNTDQYTDLILNDLRGTDNSAINAASDAVRHFVVLCHSGRIRLNYAGLVGALVDRVAFRRQTGLHSCLGHLTQLIAQRAEALDKSQTNQLALSLDAWLEHLTLEPQESPEFSASEVPGFRHQVGILAGVLAALYKLRDEPEPQSIRDWRTACANEPMPEVRRAFGSGEEFFAEQARD